MSKGKTTKTKADKDTPKEITSIPVSDSCVGGASIESVSPDSTLGVDTSGYVTWGTTVIPSGTGTISSSPWTYTVGGVVDEEELYAKVEKKFEEKVEDIVKRHVKEHAPYTDSVFTHIEKAKEEGVRRGLEADSIIIDRGLAVANGLEHAKMIMGLKVKYAKEGALPLGSGFVVYKGEETPEEKRARSRGEEERFVPYSEGMREAEDGLPCEAEDGVPCEEKSCAPIPGILHRKSYEFDPHLPVKMFIYYTKGGTEAKPGPSHVINVNHVVAAEDVYVSKDGGKGTGEYHWAALKLTLDTMRGGSSEEVYIRDSNEANEAWDVLLYALRYETHK